ncbi:MAG: flagellar hook-length control protein FliK [Nitrospinae bacterium]|nr:flagellar hook-length control protein FliK [Nitrospinota bacterium]
MNLGIETAAQKTNGNAALFSFTAGNQEGKTSFSDILNIVQSEKQKPEETIQPKAKVVSKSVSASKAAKHETKETVKTDNAATAQEATAAEQAETANAEDAEQVKNAAETKADAKAEPVKTENKNSETPAIVQTISMAELIKSLQLTDEQVAKLADAAGMKVDELRQAKLEVTTQTGKDAQAGLVQLKAVLADGKEKDLAKLLGADAKTAASAKEFAAKIADLLKLDEKQSQEMFSALNVSSLEVKQEVKPAELPHQQQASKTAPLTVAQASASAVKEVANTESKDNGGLNTKAETEKGIAETATVKNESGKSDFATLLDKAANVQTPHTIAAHAAEKATPTHAVESVAAADKAHGARIMNQITEKASILSLPNATQTKITLTPESLGTVDIKLHMADATVKASIVVESAAVKHAVEQNLDQLKSALHEQGIMVQEMNVSVNQNNGGNNFAAQSEARESQAAENRESRGPKNVESAPAARAPRARRGNSLVDVTA